MPERESLAQRSTALGPVPGEVDAGDSVIHEINVTPFVDVMLVLLVIFMVTTPALLPMLRLDLPGPDASMQSLDKAKPEASEPLLFELDAKGTMRLDRAVVESNEALSARLAEAVSRDPQVELQLRVDASTAYESISRIFLIAQEQGLQRMSLVMDHGAAAASTASRTKP